MPSFEPYTSSAQLRESRRRQQEAKERDEDICRSCFQTDHVRRVCNQIPIVACAECYKMNVFTTNCCESKGRAEIQGTRQVLRFAGFPIPRMFIDVNIMTFNIPALIDTGSTHSTIDYYTARLLKGLEFLSDIDECFTTSTGMSVPIGLRGQITYLNCKVDFIEPTIHLKLGMDFFMMRPFSFTFENITVNSRKNWPLRHHEETNYVYNTPRGRELRWKLGKIDYEFKESSREKAFNRHREYFSNNPHFHNKYY